MAEPKDFDSVLRLAFERGTEFGSRYPEIGAIPDAEREVQFDAFKAALRGDAWSPIEWENARHRAGLLKQTRQCGCTGGPHGGYTDPECR